MNIWLEKLILKIDNNPKLNKNTKAEFKRFLIYYINRK